MNSKAKQLKLLLSAVSKHSGYQLLSERLTAILGLENLEIKSRHEIERLTFLKSKLHIKDSKILDIGGNTGYFSFEMLDLGARNVEYYEGNKMHADFVKDAASLLNYGSRIEIHNDYFLFKPELIRDDFDIILLLNVLHHIGDDYGDKTIGIKNAKASIIESINILADKSRYLVLQLGFCWQGNRTKLLFDKGTKSEMIEFVTSGTKDKWELMHVGIAEDENGKISYNPVEEKNLIRNDKMGEFLNRPIFIFKSKSKRFTE